MLGKDTSPVVPFPLPIITDPLVLVRSIGQTQSAFRDSSRLLISLSGVRGALLYLSSQGLDAAETSCVFQASCTHDLCFLGQHETSFLLPSHFVSDSLAQSYFLFTLGKYRIPCLCFKARQSYSTQHKNNKKLMGAI